MAMEITNNYNNVYESAYGTQKQQTAKKEETKETAAAQKNVDAATDNSDYLGKLQKKVPSMKLGTGYSIPTSKDRRVGTLTVHPDILAQMQNNPEKEKYYTQRMKDIERAEKLGESITTSRGFTTEYSHWFIDKDGKIWHTARTVRKDKLNEKLRKKAQENAEKQIEKTRENSRRKTEELAEKLEKKMEDAKDGTLVFNDDEIQTLIDAAKETEAEASRNNVHSGHLPHHIL
ncbi:MAG: hypothetical protein J1F02_03080 [Lachnospiraceae bacterium]|nr:hypothetical protein [Lachnospiraceae bacterium]